MKAEDVTRYAGSKAVDRAGHSQATAPVCNGSSHRRRWPNGSNREWSTAPYHPQTQGCWHQTLKNRILLENYYLPGDGSRPSSATTIITATTRDWAPHAGR